jgi:hypothetical protein
MRTDDIYAPDWNVARTYLRARFRQGTIDQASRSDLKRALVILAHAGDAGNKDPWPKETEDFRWTISQLLQVRTSEDLRWWTFWVAIGALVVSVVAVAISYYKHCK